MAIWWEMGQSIEGLANTNQRQTLHMKRNFFEQRDFFFRCALCARILSQKRPIALKLEFETEKYLLAIAWQLELHPRYHLGYGHASGPTVLQVKPNVKSVRSDSLYVSGKREWEPKIVAKRLQVTVLVAVHITIRRVEMPASRGFKLWQRSKRDEKWMQFTGSRKKSSADCLNDRWTSLLALKYHGDYVAK